MRSAERTLDFALDDDDDARSEDKENDSLEHIIDDLIKGKVKEIDEPPREAVEADATLVETITHLPTTESVRNETETPKIAMRRRRVRVCGNCNQEERSGVYCRRCGRKITVRWVEI